MARRRKLLPKPVPLPYVTLAEIRQSGKPANPDTIAPKDKQRICAAGIGHFDDIPHAEIRNAIREARDVPLFRYDGVIVDYTAMALMMLDKGLTVAQIVNEIDRVDENAINLQRKQGVYAPKA